MSPDARTLLEVALRSRNTPRHVPGHQGWAREVMPAHRGAGVSRLDVWRRLKRWGLPWPEPRVSKTLDELIGLEVVIRTDNGLRLASWAAVEAALSEAA